MTVAQAPATPRQGMWNVLPRDVECAPKPQEPPGLREHHSKDWSHNKGSCKVKGLTADCVCVHSSQGLAPKTLEPDSRGDSAESEKQQS